jgi:transposase-like protein
VERLHGSAEAKRRLRAILQTVAQGQRLCDASADLDLTPQRFHMLRQQALQTALNALEPGRAGRPRKRPAAAAERLQALERENQQLRQELSASRVREEIALVLPGRQDPGEKKRGSAGARGQPTPS